MITDMLQTLESRLFAAAALLAVSAAALFLTEPFRRSAPASARVLPLHVLEEDGRVRVDWDPVASIAAEADSARLIAHDGGATRQYEVDRRALRNGGLDYVKRSDDVLLEFVLLQNGRQLHRATIRAAASTTATPPAAPGPRQR
jgi:hypothetical protein